jgi:hypothetical protein
MRAAFAEGSRRGDDGQRTPTAMGIQELSTHELPDGVEDAGGGVPTEEHPEPGRFLYASVPISAGVRWVATDGAHVIESTEFEIRAMGDSWPTALESFWLHANELFSHLAELTRAEKATPDEMEMAGVLGNRIVEGYRAYANHLESSIERLQSPVRSRKDNLLAALNLRQPNVVEVKRDGRWDPDRQTRENSRTPLPV